jgi:NADH-ubiquinone oxidoreductase chain 3
MLFIFVPILAFILLALNVLLAPHRPDEAKVSAYECGFLAIEGQTRASFHIHFYMVAMLFLVFDLEILLLFPLAVTLYQVSIYGFVVALVFFIVLTIGFILEIGSGAIKISDSDINLKTKNKFNPLRLASLRIPNKN